MKTFISALLLGLALFFIVERSLGELKNTTTVPIEYRTLKFMLEERESLMSSTEHCPNSVSINATAVAVDPAVALGLVPAPASPTISTNDIDDQPELVRIDPEPFWIQEDAEIGETITLKNDELCYDKQPYGIFLKFGNVSAPYMVRLGEKYRALERVEIGFLRRPWVKVIRNE